MKQASQRVPQLDGIRGLAILLVLIWHFVVAPADAAHASGLRGMIAHLGVLTWSGVDLFFVLSGFLIGGILVDAKESPSYFKAFYVRRVFRILPIYLALTIGFALIWAVSVNYRAVIQGMVGAPMPWWTYFTFTQNFWLAHHNWDVFLALTWSLAVEEQFYLMLPAIIRIVPRRLLLGAAIALAISSAATRCLLYLHYGSSWGIAAYTLIFCRADALMLGVICALLLRDAKWKEFLVARANLLRAGAVVMAAGVGLFIYRKWGMSTFAMSTLGYTWMAMFYASILLIAMVSPRGVLARAFTTRWLMWLGTIAYGLYLFHGITPGVAGYLVSRYWSGPSAIAQVVGPAGALVAAILLAHFSWRYFESKLVRIGHQFSYGAAARPASAVPLMAPIEN